MQDWRDMLKRSQELRLKLRKRLNQRTAQCDQSFFAPKGASSSFLGERPEECLKKSFSKASRGSLGGARKSSSSLTELVSRPAALQLRGDDRPGQRVRHAGPEAAEAVRRTKRPEDRNAIAVVDRGIQTLKKDLATRVARKGGQWSDHFNGRPEAAVLQDNADKFQLKLPAPQVSSRAARLVARHRLGVLVLQRFHGGRPGEDVHHHQAYFVFPRVFWKSMRSACSRSLGPSAADLPSARGRGACTCRPTLAFSALKAMAYVEVALSRESVQLPRVPHVEATYFLPQKGA